MKKLSYLITILIIAIYIPCKAQITYQWRGANRDGKYDEKQLLKSWPVNGPEMLWNNTDIGIGYGSPAVTRDMIFINGMIDSLSYTSAFDLNGNLLWRTSNGKEFIKSPLSVEYPGSRSTPTVIGDLVYVSSGMGSIACLDKKTGKIRWTVDMMNDFKGFSERHGYAESLMVDEHNVYCFPGGPVNNIIALDRFSGKVVWSSRASNDTVSYCSPVIIKLPERNILATFSAHYFIGLDTKNGDLLWSQRQDYHIYHQHCNTPVYCDGYIYYVSAEGNGAVKLELSPDGSDIREIWRNKNVKNAFNGFLKIDNHLFCPDNTRKIKCVDINNGQVTDSLNISNGSIILADSMLYCYSSNGDINLIKLTGTKMDIVSKFKCAKGTKEHFAHPVISNGILYIRHGNVLMAYNIKRLTNTAKT